MPYDKFTKTPPTSDLTHFSKWLSSKGFSVEEGGNQWEILRAVKYDEVLSVYRNAKGRESWHPLLRSIYVNEFGREKGQ